MRRFGLVVLFSVLLASCSGSAVFNSKELTRTRALALLNKSGKITPTQDILITHEAAKLGINAPWLSPGMDIVDEPARRYFLRYMDMGVRRAKLRTPLRREMTEVTGISDAPMGQGIKEVDFMWRFSDDVPEFVTKYTGMSSLPREGRATFKLYDDGWRVEEVDFDVER